MLIELKTGETLNGHLVSCDTYMNIMLKEVVQTSPDGDKFFRLPECYVRGNNVSWRIYILLRCGRMKLTAAVDRSSICGFRMRWWMWLRINNRRNRVNAVEEGEDGAIENTAMDRPESYCDTFGLVRRRRPTNRIGRYPWDTDACMRASSICAAG
jgi:U6 snRNA-associated Sm-like protein LSm4